MKRDMRHWLDRNGQSWAMKGYSFRSWLGLIVMVVGFTAGWRPGAIAGLLLLVADTVLPMLVRCHVCGLRLWTSAAARELNSGDRGHWLLALDSCPVCGDDGTATNESLARWTGSGASPEEPYWSQRRVLLAIIIAIVLAGGGVAVGVLFRIRP